MEIILSRRWLIVRRRVGSLVRELPRLSICYSGGRA